MLETLDRLRIKQYLGDLRRELAVRGFKGESLNEIVAETQAHLDEAMEETRPESEAEVEHVLKQFGNATAMAKKLAVEVDRTSTSKRFLWPMGFLLLALPLFHNAPLNTTFFRPELGTSGQFGLQIMGFNLFPSGLWIGSVFLTICAIVFFVMGYRARRPLFGQFGTAIVTMCAACTVWFMATSYPVGYSPDRNGQANWFQPIHRSDYQKELATMNRSMTSVLDASRMVRLGKRVFSDSALASFVPSEYKFGNLYLTPEAIREVKLGIKPNQLSPILLTASWPDAVKRWNQIQKNREPAGSEADEVLRYVPDTLASQQFSIDYLKRIHDAPISSQATIDFKMAALYVIPLCVLSMICTLAGWVAWFALRALIRLRRRFLYGRRGLQALS